MDSDRGRVVTVAVCRKPGLAQLAQSILDAAGIESFIQGEHASGLYSGAMTSRVLVAEEKAEEALQLLSNEGLEVDVTPVEPIEPAAGGGYGIVWVIGALLAIALVVIFGVR